MKISVEPTTYVTWSWWITADNGVPLAKSPNGYVARADAIAAALRVLGLTLPHRPKGCSSQALDDEIYPRGVGRVYVSYGRGGMVAFAQWVIGDEFFEFVGYS